MLMQPCAGEELQVHVEGQAIFNTTPQALQGALDGAGLAYVPDDLVGEHVSTGRLQRVLEDWCPVFPGYHLYYPSRRQASPAFALVLDALRLQNRQDS
jgi:DNA-binding transcriptional LysR family regulator